MDQLEVKNQKNRDDQDCNDNADDPFVFVHSSRHISQNIFAPAEVIIHPMKLQRIVSNHSTSIVNN